MQHASSKHVATGLNAAPRNLVSERICAEVIGGTLAAFFQHDASVACLPAGAARVRVAGLSDQVQRLT